MCGMTCGMSGVLSPTHLEGVPIPLKHWKSVYSNLGLGNKTWTGIKQLWHSWNVCVSYPQIMLCDLKLCSIS